MLETISQIAILVMGSIAVFFINSKHKKWRHRGAVIGLLHQPFWFYTIVNNEQWGILPLIFIYVVSWIMGIVNNRKSNGI